MYDTAGESLKRLAEAKLSLAARTTSLKALEHRLARASEDFLNAKPGVRRDELQELVGELTVSVADARAAARASNSTFRRARQASLGSCGRRSRAPYSTSAIQTPPTAHMSSR